MKRSLLLALALLLTGAGHDHDWRPDSGAECCKEQKCQGEDGKTVPCCKSWKTCTWEACRLCGATRNKSCGACS